MEASSPEASGLLSRSSSSSSSSEAVGPPLDGAGLSMSVMSSRLAYKTSVAVEREESANALERGMEKRRAVLDALAATLDANAARVAKEDLAAQHKATEALRREDEAKTAAKTVVETRHETEKAAAWLLKEAARLEATEQSKRVELGEWEKAVKASNAEVEEKRLEALQTEERLKDQDQALQARLAALVEREAKCADLASRLEAQRCADESMTAQTLRDAELLKARIADVDARAHAVAAADEAARERSAALAQRSMALKQAQVEIERRAREADDRLQRAQNAQEALDKATALHKTAEESALYHSEQARALTQTAEQKKLEAERLAMSTQSDAEAWRTKTLTELEAERFKWTLEKEARDRADADRSLGLDARQSDLDSLHEAATTARNDAVQRELELKDQLEKTLTAQTASSTWEAEMVRREAELEKLRLQVEALRAQPTLGSPPASVGDEGNTHELTLNNLEALQQDVATQQAALQDKEAKLRADRGKDRAMLVASTAPWLATRRRLDDDDDDRGGGGGDDDDDVAEWARAVARQVSDDQKASYDAARTARLTLRTLGTSGDATLWALLPRQVRAALRDAVALNGRVREAIADLQAAAVKRFLQLSAARNTTRDNNVGLDDDSATHVVLNALRGLASQELSRRRCVLGALRAAHYADPASLAALQTIPQRAAPAKQQFFQLKHNHFASLRLRLPAAKARFAAATARWATPEFRRFVLYDLLGGDADCATPVPNVFKTQTVEVRFDEDEDGRHVPNAALVFEDARSLATCFHKLDAAKKVACVGVANGFVNSTTNKKAHLSRQRASTDGSYAARLSVDERNDDAPGGDDDADDDDADHRKNIPTPPAYQVAVAVDLFHRGVLCDVRLRLRALERTQRHLGSLRFLAETDSVESILLPVWRDVSHCDGFVQDGLDSSLEGPPPYETKGSLLYRPKASHDWAAPPKWQTA